MRPRYPEFKFANLRYNDHLCRKHTKGIIQKTLLSPEPLDNLGKKNEDFELSESFADAHAGALAKGEAHKRMD